MYNVHIVSQLFNIGVGTGQKSKSSALHKHKLSLSKLSFSSHSTLRDQSKDASSFKQIFSRTINRHQVDCGKPRPA